MPEIRAEFAALAELGYDGRLSVEASYDNLETDCAGTLALLKSLERESQPPRNRPRAVWKQY